MPPADLITRPCTIVNRSESDDTDELGNEIPSEDLVDGVWEVQQRNRREQGDEAELSDTLWDAYFLAGTKLRTGDAVIDDELGHFELVGDPWPARNPRTQQASHLEATVRQIRGSEDPS